MLDQAIDTELQPKLSSKSKLWFIPARESIQSFLFDPWLSLLWTP
jgi:hypothetical protein